MFPLCGASLDLGWLHSRGHTVVGVEGVRKAVEKLFRWEVVFAHSYKVLMLMFSDAELEAEVTELEGGVLRFRSPDSRLTVFVADFFAVTPQLLGTFDAVFDRWRLYLA